MPLHHGRKSVQENKQNILDAWQTINKSNNHKCNEKHDHYLTKNHIQVIYLFKIRSRIIFYFLYYNWIHNKDIYIYLILHFYIPCMSKQSITVARIKMYLSCIIYSVHILYSIDNLFYTQSLFLYSWPNLYRSHSYFYCNFIPSNEQCN